LGEIEAAKDLLATIIGSDGFAKHQNDQLLFTNAFLQKTAPIQLDCHCRLFQSLYLSSADVAWKSAPRRLQNRVTGQFPLVVHGNGKSNMQPILAGLGLLPSLGQSLSQALKHGLMAENQYEFLVKTIRGQKACRLLVIGAGHDTELWYNCSQGNMACVENNAEWFPRLPCEIIIPQYRGTVGKWLRKIELPTPIARPWDIVIVDGPEGHSANSIGRQESIFWASQVASRIVFVHDYDRKWERQLCDKYLGHPTQVITFGSQPNRLLAVFER
jgi:hypothetical protein